jgi:hypothetical protein
MSYLIHEVADNNTLEDIYGLLQLLIVVKKYHHH